MDGDDLLSLQRRKNPLHYTAFRPTAEFLVYRIPIPELLRQRPPLAAVFDHIQDCVYEVSVVGPDITALNRKVTGNPLILRFTNFHAKIIILISYSINSP